MCPLQRKEPLALVCSLVVLIALATAHAKDNEQPRSSFDELQSAVAALKKEEVAWRKIDWKTCLIDGIREAREQNKPIMLWVFIDRPIDDERC